MEVVRAWHKEQCRIRLPPTTNEHRRDRMGQPVSLTPLQFFGLLEKIGRAALRCEGETAERDLA
jgi:hypothetical protein